MKKINATPHAEGWPLMKRLLKHYVSQEKGTVFFAVICMLLAAGAVATNAWLLQPVLDDVFLKRDADMLRIIPLAVLAIALVNAFASYGHTNLMRAMGQRIIARMQLDMFSHLIHADLATFHDQGSGRLISRFTSDIYLMRNAVSGVLTGLAKDFITMIFLIGVMFYQSWQLAIIAFLVFPIAVYPVLKLGRRMRKISDQTQQQMGSFASQLDETFVGVRMVKAYGQEEFEIGRAHGIIDRLHKLYIRSSRVQAATSPILELLSSVGIASVIWYGGYQVIESTTTPGTFFSFIAAMIMAYKPAKTVAGLNNVLQEGLAAAARFFHVMDIKPIIHDRAGAMPLHIEKGEIRLENISFRYAPNAGGVEQINMVIPAGKTVALVGPSGGGKSTLMNLLLRFYEIDSGRITIDGADIRDATLASLRSHMALVSQDIVLFDDTVRSNIAYGRRGATETDILEAARMANADEFICKLPQGYDTPIGPGGVKLSGGQRQRIAIARAMLKNAPILLLDEATSALDTTSERKVQQALMILMKNRTTLVIAHRLSTIMNADVIHVLAAGRIVESGTHAELLARRGHYHALYAELQAAETQLPQAAML